MALFGWLSGSKKILYTNDENIQHRITPEQYGVMCVQWATSNVSKEIRSIKVLAEVRPSSDILNKISTTPLMATAHATAFMCAVYSSYSVVRLQVPNAECSKIINGIAQTVLTGCFPDHPDDPAYRKALLDQIGKSSALLLQTAGELQESGDRLLFGIGGAFQSLLFSLENEYEAIDPPYRKEKQNSKKQNIFDGTFINPAIEATRDIASDKLLSSKFLSPAAAWVKQVDRNKSLLYV